MLNVPSLAPGRRAYNVYELDPGKLGAQLVEELVTTIVLDRGCELAHGRRFKDLAHGFRLLIVDPCVKEAGLSGVNDLCRQILESGYQPDSRLAIVGGGAILNVGTLAAAGLFRGVEYVSLPTTLIAMSDVCVGGKGAVNVGNRKNIYGCFWDPHAVFLDFTFLWSIPHRQKLVELAEVLKHAVCQSRELFERLERLLNKPLANGQDLPAYGLDDLSTLRGLAFETLRLKKSLLISDPLERGASLPLVFGHWVSDAIEEASRFSILHGFSVILGMRVETTLALDFGLSTELVRSRLSKLTQTLLARSSPVQLSWEAVRRALIEHRRVRNRHISVVWPSAIGFACCPQNLEITALVLKKIRDDLNCSGFIEWV